MGREGRQASRHAGSGAQVGLEGTFESWGIQVAGRGDRSEAQNPEVAIAQSYAEHRSRSRAARPSPSPPFFPVARSVSKTQSTPSGWSVTELAKTGPRAWCETSSLSSGEVRFDPGKDLKGPSRWPPPHQG